MRSGIGLKFHEVFNKASEGGVIAFKSEVINRTTSESVGNAGQDIVSGGEVQVIDFSAKSVESRSGAMQKEREVIFRDPNGAKVLEHRNVEIEAFGLIIFPRVPKQIEVRSRLEFGLIIDIRAGQADGGGGDILVGNIEGIHINLEGIFKVR